MNILFLFGHKLGLGGHFKSAQAFVYEFVKEGHNVYVLAPGGKTETIQPFKEVGANFSDLSLNNEKTSKITKIRSFFVMNKQISEAIFVYQIDVVHAQDSSILFEGFKAACFHKKPFIITQAGGKFHDLRPPNKTHLVLYSEELNEGYKSVYHINKPITSIVSERINDQIYRPKSVYLKDLAGYNLPKEGFNFFFAIRFHTQKESWINSLLHFTKTINFRKETNFIVAGDGELLTPTIEAANSIQNTKSNVKFFFLGAVYQDITLSRLINFSDICIGNGRLLMEAMACKKPVLILGENTQFELVDNRNIEIIRKFNFSGRHFHNINYSETEQKILIEKIFESQKINELENFSYTYFRNHLSAKIGAKTILDIYSSAIEKNRISTIRSIDFYKWRIERYFRQRWDKLLSFI